MKKLITFILLGIVIQANASEKKPYGIKHWQGEFQYYYDTNIFNKKSTITVPVVRAPFYHARDYSRHGSLKHFRCCEDTCDFLEHLMKKETSIKNSQEKSETLKIVCNKTKEQEYYFKNNGKNFIADMEMYEYPNRTPYKVADRLIWKYGKFIFPGSLLASLALKNSFFSSLKKSFVTTVLGSACVIGTEYFIGSKHHNKLKKKDKKLFNAIAQKARRLNFDAKIKLNNLNSNHFQKALGDHRITSSAYCNILIKTEGI